MADDENTEFSIEGLERLARMFKKAPEIHVGILEDKPRETETSVGGLTNAQIGAFHEFGPVGRSFLRVPLITHLNKRITASGILTRQSLARAMRAGSLTPIMSTIGIIAEDIVLGAFDSGGYGKWAPLRASTMARKHNQQILVETAQLRNAITHELAEGEDE